MKATIALAAAALLATTTLAQVKVPQASPLAKVEQKVGLTDLSITYSRPSARGRSIYGTVVPYGKLWRLGANAPTRFSTSDTITLGGALLPAGEYAVYALPTAGEWTFYFGKDLNTQAGSFKTEDAVLSVKAKPSKLGAKVETFTALFGTVADSTAELSFWWENTAVSIAIATPVAAKVQASIEKSLFDVGNLWAAANYYYNTGQNLPQALAWAQQVAAKRNTYWVIHFQAKVLQKMGDCKQAKQVAQRSLAMAQEAKADDYIRNNQELIKACK